MTGKRKLILNESMHGSPWADIVDREDPTFDAVAGQEQEDTEIDLSGLTEKQRFVIECSFGIGRPELSERDIATLMGISGPAVHKLKEKALTKLRGLAK